MESALVSANYISLFIFPGWTELNSVSVQETGFNAVQVKRDLSLCLISSAGSHELSVTFIDQYRVHSEVAHSIVAVRSYFSRSRSLYSLSYNGL